MSVLSNTRGRAAVAAGAAAVIGGAAAIGLVALPAGAAVTAQSSAYGVAGSGLWNHSGSPTAKGMATNSSGSVSFGIGGAMGHVNSLKVHAEPGLATAIAGAGTIFPGTAGEITFSGVTTTCDNGNGTVQVTGGNLAGTYTSAKTVQVSRGVHVVIGAQSSSKGATSVVGLRAVLESGDYSGQTITIGFAKCGTQQEPTTSPTSTSPTTTTTSPTTSPSPTKTTSTSPSPTKTTSTSPTTSPSPTKTTSTSPTTSPSPTKTSTPTTEPTTTAPTTTAPTTTTEPTTTAPPTTEPTTTAPPTTQPTTTAPPPPPPPTKIPAGL